MAEADGNRDQAALWNGSAGEGWVQTQALLDLMYQPFADVLAESCGTARRVLDVGCGAGATSLALAAKMGVGGECTGIDISQPLIAVARARAAQQESTARFVCADAQNHAFALGHFDLLVSRFGVSFFADPVAAFANLRHAARSGAALRFLTWRGQEENDFMTVAERAAAPLLPQLPPFRAGQPGPFGLADETRIADILRQSGWEKVAVSAVDRTCAFPASALTHYLAWMGPVGRLLQKTDGDMRARILDVVQPAFDRFVRDGEVRFAGACWMIEARAP
jgi:SAM-dependent methyltransferase